jgi:hypothetical protein
MLANLLVVTLFLVFSTLVYHFVESELSHEAGRHIAGTKFGHYLELCRMHNIQLDIGDLPDKDGDESFRTFSFTRAGVTRVLRPRATLRALQLLEAGDADQTFAILKMAQA